MTYFEVQVLGVEVHIDYSMKHWRALAKSGERRTLGSIHRSWPGFNVVWLTYPFTSITEVFMSEEREKEILNEIQKMNQKLDEMNQSKRVSTPVLYVIAILGFLLIAPILVDLIIPFIN
ncbi:hypothetical protein [Halobacillus sp. Nhm2S1]|uniref:hypothetical protein n=1 Tax=Halobacillus sp. Nhm2S1 TaxID=2866716 RepID=UPI001C737A9E|nr:hypothetical protein [Halobacillus sp. Nhm2S1]MBX0356875.1 hypothetical protein [Halobacillus sp. Nhm2S1]